MVDAIRLFFQFSNQRLLAVALLSITLLNGCSSSPLLTRKDYQQSVKSFYKEESPKKTIEHLPKGEKDTFIKTMELAYLNLLQGKPAIKDLEKYSKLLGKRVRFDASRELKSFFYVELPEGYYASEHEVILLHMLLSWGYSLQGKYEKAAVEARISSYLLEAPWSSEGHFDDAMLRVWLGSLWTMCGSWEEARVDYRAAWHLDKSLKWAKELADLDAPPEQLVVVLGGVGPTPIWNPDSNINPLRGLRHLQFEYMGRKSKIAIHDQHGNSLTPFLSSDSRYWYQRHFERDNAIHELIEDSHYGQKMATVIGKESAKTTASLAWGTTVGVSSVAAGYWLINIGGTSGAFEAGLGIAYIGLDYAYGIIKRTMEDSIHNAEQELNPSENYRFVRFLPEYIWVGWSNKKFSSPLRLKIENDEHEYEREITTSISHLHSQVYLTYLSDVDINSVSAEMWLSHEEKWQQWEDIFKHPLSEPYLGKTNWDNWLELTKNLIQLSYEPSVPDGGSLSRKTKITFFEKQIVVEFRKGLFQDNLTLTIDLESQSLIADNPTQELLVSSYPQSELLSEIDERLYALEKSAIENRVQICSPKLFWKPSKINCSEENLKVRPPRSTPLKIAPK